MKTQRPVKSSLILLESHWAIGCGTGGTVPWEACVLPRERPETKIILSEPANVQIVGSGHAQQTDADGSTAVSHPHFEPHPIED